MCHPFASPAATRKQRSGERSGDGLGGDRYDSAGTGPELRGSRALHGVLDRRRVVPAVHEVEASGDGHQREYDQGCGDDEAGYRAQPEHMHRFTVRSLAIEINSLSPLDSEMGAGRRLEAGQPGFGQALGGSSPSSCSPRP